MTILARPFRASMAATSVAALILVAGCSEERQAEADTPLSEAEVSTELPETVVSDEQLEATANAAAEIAATPPAQIVPVPVGGANATAPAAGGTATTTTNGAGGTATTTTNGAGQ